MSRPKSDAFCRKYDVPSYAKADAVIAYAKRIKDWPLLQEAVDAKLEDQE